MKVKILHLYLTFISGFHTPLPFRSWTVHLLHCSQCSILWHFIHHGSLPDVKLEKNILMFLASLWHLSRLKFGGRRKSWSRQMSCSIPPQGLWQLFSAWNPLSISSPYITFLSSLASYYSSLTFQKKWFFFRRVLFPISTLHLIKLVLISIPLVPGLPQHYIH